MTSPWQWLPVLAAVGRPSATTKHATASRSMAEHGEGPELNTSGANAVADDKMYWFVWKHPVLAWWWLMIADKHILKLGNIGLHECVGLRVTWQKHKSQLLLDSLPLSHLLVGCGQEKHSALPKDQEGLQSRGSSLTMIQPSEKLGLNWFNNGHGNASVGFTHETTPS